MAELSYVKQKLKNVFNFVFMKADKNENISTFLLEELCLKIPVIGEDILEKLDNKSLTKLRKTIQ